MGRLANAINYLQNALGDLFPEAGPYQPMEFPTKALNSLRGEMQPIAQSQSNPLVPSKPESKPLGKITSFNYKGDPYGDTKSKKGIAAFGRLTNTSLAVSPDIEKQFREAGINPKDKVLLTLADGSKIERTWDDRTMQDKQAIKTYGKPLRGRFDLNIPDYNKPHEKDEMAVVGFQKLASK